MTPDEALDVLKLLTDTVRMPVYIEALDTVAAECKRLREERRWIPCSERLPPEIDGRGLPPHVLVASESRSGEQWVSACSYLSKYGSFSHYHGAVTHWMPLPEGPG